MLICGRVCGSFVQVLSAESEGHHRVVGGVGLCTCPPPQVGWAAVASSVTVAIPTEEGREPVR